jgi:hypothetical protein
MPDIATLKDSQVSSDYPGQTSLNFFGEGGRSNREAGRELADDREQFEFWYLVSRPPENETWSAGDETEYLVQRLGDDDVIATNSRNLEIQKQVRDKLSRELAKGEVVLFTGDGTDSICMALRPSGYIDVYTTQNFRIGGTGATSAIARSSDLLSYFNTAITGLVAKLNTHVHVETGATTLPPNNAPGAPPSTFFVSLPAAIASATGECD